MRFLQHTYVKLQDAYVAERNAAGNWTVLGYTKPASTNFTYSEQSSFSDNTIAIADLKNTNGWQAVNNVAMNDCASASSCKWMITMAAGDKGGQISYEAHLSAAALPLTPNFGALSTDGSGSTISAQ